MRGLISLLLLSSPEATASPERRYVPALTAGLHVPFAVQPGVAVGVYVPVADWRKPATRKGEAFVKRRSVELGPRLAFFGRPYLHYDLGAAGEVGFRFMRTRRHMAQTIWLSLGYVASLRIETIGVDLSSGDQTNTREVEHLFVPTLAYELGQMPTPRLGWFLRFDLGRIDSFTQAGSVFVALGGGVRFDVSGADAQGVRR